MRTETTDVTEINGMHLMGHTCANLNGELFFVWGGSCDNVNYLPISNKNIWIYETLTGYWRHRNCSGDCPPYLSSTTSALIGRKMYVFGGHSTSQDNWLNCLYCLDLETFVWTDLGSQAKAEPTKPIRSDKCTGWSYEEKFYIFGGYGWSQTEQILQLLDKQKDLQLTPDYRWPKFGWNNQLVEYDPRDCTWRWPSYKGNCPSARAAHSGALMGSKYYIFGGRDCNERLNDLYVLDMSTFEWTQIATFTDLDPNSAIARPIHHLLDADSDYAAEGDEENSAQVGEDQEEPNQVLDPVGSDDEESEVVEILTPSPSSSHDQPHPSTTANIANTSNYPLNSDDQPEDLSSSSDDDEDYFEYPHPSHLLERWSLSSAASNSVALDQNINCHRSRNFESFINDLSNLTIGEQPTNLNAGASDALGDDIGEHSSAQDGGQINAQVDNQAVSQSSDPGSRPELESKPQVPIGRSFSSFTPISKSEILLYGGVSSQDKNLNDCWVFNIDSNNWARLDLKYKKPRLWHTGARTKSNEVVIIGGSSSGKMDEFCTEVLSISKEPKSLKRLALDCVAKSIKMRSIAKGQRLPLTVRSLIRLRKQAMALTSKRAAT